IFTLGKLEIWIGIELEWVGMCLNVFKARDYKILWDTVYCLLKNLIEEYLNIGLYQSIGF
ncbi:MAG: hypothetical protein QXL49_00505, partial [Acidilobaceae archaeon]